MNSRLFALVDERVGRSWTLFLDRDGVVNTRIMGGYVRTWDEFHFEPGVLDALAVLARWAPRIVLVTNQQGIGKGLMTEADLAELHERMRHDIVEAGGRLDGIRYCPHLDADDCPCRKPRPGMAQDDLAEHPEMDGALSVMVGDTPGDVEMGRRLAAANGGGATVRIAPEADPAADLTYPSLATFAAALAPLVAASPGHSAE
ncbi:histidinol phosphatase [Microbacterium testaceum StLB037]|uniref:D,D-heptose 1,7-bisphosphate phosphatase n=1 Tax=Microbacterium testaceum (strain StLB037) TaxID=979556 RepID=E8NC93_MICTS|nr:HAD family hydrolase [Microbacterium testaceum]BAJ73541.1 histidinol phosphatase [Microbacterium testaceum StLB037]